MCTSLKSCSDDLHVFQGHPRLVNALAKTFSPLMGRDLDANEEIVVTVGAYGSLFAAAQGLLNPGDEVRIITELNFLNLWGI